VNITGNELTAASSAVAALAIVGGYLGVRSANRNALKIAREERSSKRKDELDALKRTTYAKTLAALHALATANVELVTLAGTNVNADVQLAVTRKRAEAMQAAYDSIAELELVSSNDQLYVLAKEVLDQAAMSTRRDSIAYTFWSAKLRASLHDDLRGTEPSDREKLDRDVEIARANQNVRVATAAVVEVAEEVKRAGTEAPEVSEDL
jgi:hypothetical protein